MEKTDLWDESFAKIDSFLKEVIRPHFPNARLKTAGMTGNADVAPSFFEAHLSLNKLFDKTRYEAPHQGEILHYTSIAGMLSILQENGIRLSPFSGLSDSKELVYASALHTGIIKDRVSKVSEWLKNSLYSLSGKLSDLKSEEMDKDTYMWETYGRGGAGVYIRLEYTDVSPRFSLGKVLYGQSNLDIIKELDRNANAFFSSNGFSLVTSGEFFSLIHAFHKSQRYYQEQEVRLLYDGTLYPADIPYEGRFVYEPDRYGSLLKKLFIPFDSTSGTVPKLRISQIVFGYECSIGQVLSYMEMITKNFPDSDFAVGLLTNELEAYWFRN
jgi:hypothetical protein